MILSIDYINCLSLCRYCIPLRALETHPNKKLQLIEVEMAADNSNNNNSNNNNNNNNNTSTTTSTNGLIPALKDLETDELVHLHVGTNLTQLIGIQKYEEPGMYMHTIIYLLIYLYIR